MLEPNNYILPKVSIIIPTKNRCSLLLETLASVSTQTYDNWEAIVVDDGSTDETYTQMVALTEHESRIQFIRRKNPQPGAPKCRNEGVDLATGEYLIFLDSDDYLASSCVQNRVQAMQANSHLDFGVFSCQIFKNKPGDIKLLWNTEQSIEDDINRFLALDIPWQTTSPMWKRQAFIQLGKWDESFLSWQDWELHLRAIIMGLKYQRFSQVDCFWRVPDKESIGLKSKTPAHLKSHELLLDKIYYLLLQAQLLAPKRQELLAGLHFWLAEQWVNHNDCASAARVWRACYEKQLISNLKLWEGIMYFCLPQINLGKRTFRKYLKLRWSEKLMPSYSSTFRKTPLPIQESVVSQLQEVSRH